MQPLLQVRVIPNASRTQIVEWKEDTLKVKLQAPAQDGKANAALIHFLAKSAGCRKNSITLVSGEKSRHKVLRFEQFTHQELAEWLQGFA